MCHRVLTRQLSDAAGLCPAVQFRHCLQSSQISSSHSSVVQSASVLCVWLVSATRAALWSFWRWRHTAAAIRHQNDKDSQGQWSLWHSAFSYSRNQMDKMLTPTVQCISGNGELYLPLQNLLMHLAPCWHAKVCLTHRIDFPNFVTHDI